MDIEEAGRQSGVAEIDQRGVDGSGLARDGRELSDSPVFDDEQWAIDLLGGREQAAGGEVKSYRSRPLGFRQHALSKGSLRLRP
jgi:hypothetical protein